MLPLLWTLTIGCRAPEDAPTGWRSSGCSAAAVGEGGVEGVDDKLAVRVDDGTVLQVQLRRPKRVDCVGAVVVVPPGFEPGDRVSYGHQSDRLLDHGLLVVGFDPRGRGESEGQEDANGHRGQDDLAALLRWVSHREEVDPERILLFSRSFGGALAAGALGRHEDLAVLAWVDVESPGYLSEDLLYAPEANQDAFDPWLPEDPAEVEAFWAEREPAQLIAGLQRPYLRFQGLPDHALGSRTAHAAAMLKNASLAPALRYNEEPVTVEQVSAGYVRDHAIRDGIDPESLRVGEALLDHFR